MKEFYFDFIEHYNLSLNEKNAFKLLGDKYLCKFYKELEEIVDIYYKTDCKFLAVKALLEKLANGDDNAYFEICFVFLVICSKNAYEKYIENGYSTELFYDTFEDIILKARVCNKVYGIYGVFVAHWYSIFFKLNIFRLGRFEFEITPNFSEREYDFEDVHIGKTDTVIAVHIPESGSMAREERMDSFARAYKFFSDFRVNGKIVFVCHSWLNYTRNVEFLPANSNTLDFLNDWVNVFDEEDKAFKDCYRIFDVHYNGNPKLLKQDTSLQRAIVKWLESGNYMGHGFGVCVFDGEKIINKK